MVGPEPTVETNDLDVCIRPRRDSVRPPRIDLCGVGQIVRDDEIHIRQCHARKLLRNGLGRRAFLKGNNDHVQQQAGTAHADRSVGVGRERNIDNGGKWGHIDRG